MKILSLNQSLKDRSVLIILVSTNLRHLLTVTHDFCSASAARKSFGPQILTRILMLIVAEFCLGSRERSRIRTLSRFERRRGRERKKRKRTKIEQRRVESTWEQRTLRTGRQGVRVVPFIWAPLSNCYRRLRKPDESATCLASSKPLRDAVAINKPLGITCCRPPDRSPIMPRV